eukprot:TRINITY_DN11763_c0_g1_i1.p1 TRINITY_DN11763_c0_g1~~TRINITY_DN11763_c0_g1_i1.p1  ORF type:complete len:223 (-),score=39.93 TRINITY_DN11763_c0_g1_i1:186-776(-)
MDRSLSEYRFIAAGALLDNESASLQSLGVANNSVVRMVSLSSPITLQPAAIRTAAIAACTQPSAVVQFVDPLSGETSGGTLVYVHGVRFPSQCFCLFGTTLAYDVERISDTLLKVRSPPHEPGAVSVRVCASDDARAVMATSPGALFTYVGRDSADVCTPVPVRARQPLATASVTPNLSEVCRPIMPAVQQQWHAE